ncbi:hypothetical protein [Secundilactobacillus paracollinoides]|uniref:hypothetical protein n=1 Tax=Secundilactobacillus paracollinoides TaxID=240427 RepID=UPI0012E9CB21|nr:hypothetical protein [Secundilactobacillus paracollinoides]
MKRNGFVTLVAVAFLGLLMVLLLLEVQGYAQQQHAYNDLIKHYSQAISALPHK